MAFKKQINELKGIIILALLGIQSAALANIDCNGKSFHCVNSTHFMICVDLGGGVSTTVDDFVIPCPPTTVCKINNHFECEFVAPTTPASISRTSEVTNELDTSATTIPWEVVVTTDFPPDNTGEAHYSDLKNFTVSLTRDPESTVSVSTEAYTDYPIISTNTDSKVNTVNLATVTEFIPSVTKEENITKLEVSTISPLNYTSDTPNLATKTNDMVDLTTVTNDNVSVITEAAFITKEIISPSDPNYINTTLTTLQESNVNVTTDTVSTTEDVINNETGTSTTESNMTSDLYNAVNLTILEPNVDVTTKAILETNETINNETDTSITESDFNTVSVTTLPESNFTVTTLDNITLKGVIENETGTITTETNLNTVSLTTIPKSSFSFTTESGIGNKDINNYETGINATAILTDSQNLNTVSLTTLPHSTTSATTEGFTTMNLFNNETNTTESTIFTDTNNLNTVSLTTVFDHDTSVTTEGIITANLINNETSSNTTESTTVSDMLNLNTLSLTTLPNFTFHFTTEANIAPKDTMNNESITNAIENNMEPDSNPVSFTTIDDSTVIVTTEAIFTTRDIITNVTDTTIVSTRGSDMQNINSATLTTIPDITIEITTAPAITTKPAITAIINDEKALRTTESNLLLVQNNPELNVSLTSEAAITTNYTWNTKTATNALETNGDTGLNKFNTVSITILPEPSILATTKITTTSNDATNNEGTTEVAVTGSDTTNIGSVSSTSTTDVKSSTTTSAIGRSIAESEAHVTDNNTITKSTVQNTVVTNTELSSFDIMTQPAEKTNNATERSETANSDRVLTGDSTLYENILITIGTPYTAVTKKSITSTVTADNITESSVASSIEPIINKNTNLTSTPVTIEPQSTSSSNQINTTGLVDNGIQVTVSTINKTSYTTEPTTELTIKNVTFIVAKENTVTDKNLFNYEITSARTENNLDPTTDSTKSISATTDTNTESRLESERNVKASNANQTVGSITTDVVVVYATTESSATKLMTLDGDNLTDFGAVTETSNTVNEPDISNSNQYLELKPTASTDIYSAPTTNIVPTSSHESSTKTDFKTVQNKNESKTAASITTTEPFGNTENIASPITPTNGNILITNEPDLPVSTIVITTAKAGDSILTQNWQANVTVTIPSTSPETPLQIVTTSYATDLTVDPLEDILIEASQNTLLSTGDDSVVVFDTTSTNESGIVTVTEQSITNSNLSPNYTTEQTSESHFLTLPANGSKTTSIQKNLGTLTDKLSTIYNNVEGVDFVITNFRDTTVVTTEPSAIGHHSSSTQSMINIKGNGGTQEPINVTQIDIISKNSIQTSTTTIFNGPVTSMSATEPFGHTENTASSITLTNGDILITNEPDLPVNTTVTTTTKAGDSTLTQNWLANVPATITLTSSKSSLQQVTTSYATDLTADLLEDIITEAPKNRLSSTGDDSVLVFNKLSTNQSGTTTTTELSTINPNLSSNNTTEQTSESNVLTLPADGSKTTSVQKNLGTVTLTDKLSTSNNNVKGVDFVTTNFRDTTVVTTEPYAIDQHSSSTQSTINIKGNGDTQEPSNVIHLDLQNKSSIQTSSTTMFNVPFTSNHNLGNNLLNNSAQGKTDKSSTSVLSTESDLMTTSALITSDDLIPSITVSPQVSTTASFTMQNDNVTEETAGLSMVTQSFTPNISTDSPTSFPPTNKATSNIVPNSSFTMTLVDDHSYVQQESDIVISTKTLNISDSSNKQNTDKSFVLEESITTQNAHVGIPIIKTTSLAINKTLQNVTFTGISPPLETTFTEKSFSATSTEPTLVHDKRKYFEGSVNSVEKSSTITAETLKANVAPSIKNDASAYILQTSGSLVINNTPEVKSNTAFTVGPSDVLIQIEPKTETVKPLDHATFGDSHFEYTQPITKILDEVTPLPSLAESSTQESVFNRDVTIPIFQLKTTKESTTENISKSTISESDVYRYLKQEHKNIKAPESSTLSYYQTDKSRSTESDVNNKIKKPVEIAEPVKKTFESSLSSITDVPVLPTTTNQFSSPTGFDKSSAILVTEKNIPIRAEALQNSSKVTDLHPKTTRPNDSDKSGNDNRKLDYIKVTTINTDSLSGDAKTHSKLAQEKISSLNSESESSYSSDKEITTKNEATSTIELVTHVTEKTRKEMNDQITLHTLPFTVVTERATSKTNTKVNTNVNEQITPLIDTHFDCRNRQRGRYSDKHDCRKFYICIGRFQPIIGLCPMNTVFNEIKKQCTKNLSYCIRENEFKCAVEGRFIDFLNDADYYICVKNRQDGFIRFKFQCQKGYHLNKTSVRCIEDIEVTSQSESLKDSMSAFEKQSKESVSATEKQSKESDSATEKQSKEDKLISKNDKDVLKCEKEGKFAHPDDVRKYYVCILTKKSEYRRKIKKCDSDEVFHQEKGKCVDADDDDDDDDADG